MKPPLPTLPMSLCSALCYALVFGTQARADFLLEDFNDNDIDPTLWTVYEYGSGPEVEETNERLEVAMPGWSSGGDFGVKLATKFLLRGDFDVQVDFLLLAWPFANGVRTALGTDRVGLHPHPGVERISFGQNDYPSEPREAYLTDFPDGVHGITATDDTIGKLRLVRNGATQTGYYLSSGSWVAIHTGPAPTTDIPIMIAVFSAYQFMHWDVFMAFDNFTVTSGEIVWPPTPVEDTSWGALKILYR